MCQHFQVDEQRNDQINANELIPSGGSEFISQEREATKLYFEKFRHKEFLLSQKTKGLLSFVTQNAYQKQQDEFMQEV